MKTTSNITISVINELDGLTLGARDHQYDSPNHAHMVKCQAQAAIEFLQAEFEQKNTHLRAQTSKGSILETIAFRSEESDSSVSAAPPHYICILTSHLYIYSNITFVHMH